MVEDKSEAEGKVMGGYGGMESAMLVQGKGAS